jgi:hypothetical protein
MRKRGDLGQEHTVSRYGGSPVNRPARGADAIREHRAASKGGGGGGMTEVVNVHRSSKYPPAGRAFSGHPHGAHVMNPADGTAYNGGESHSSRQYGQRTRR